MVIQLIELQKKLCALLIRSAMRSNEGLKVCIMTMFNATEQKQTRKFMRSIERTVAFITSI